MTKRTFTVQACWDQDAGVFYSKSDIEGLHIEAATLDEFEEVIMDVAVELVVANHISPEDLAKKPLKDIIPGVVLKHPDREPADGIA